MGAWHDMARNVYRSTIMTRNVTLPGLALAFLIGLGTASTANAYPIIDISNDPAYSWTWAEDLTLGYAFTIPVGSSVTFNALAVFDVISATPSPTSNTVHTNAAGLLSSHQVGVWDSLGNLLVSTTVNPADPTAPSANTYGNWVYHGITPTTLTAGSYTIGAYYPGSIANHDPVMVQQTVIQNAAAVYVDGRYVYSSTFQQPTGTYPPNEQQYFGPTMLSVAVPDGGLTLTLLGGAMMGLVALRRKFQS